MKLSALPQLIRPANCTMMGFAVIVGAAIAVGGELSGQWPSLFLGFITGFTLTGASMVINDYYDREIDAINEPERPVPSGRVSPKEALILASALTAAGLAAAFFTSIPCLALAIASWMVSTTYNTVGKATGLPGNLLVSVCVAVPFVYGSLAVGELNPIVLLFAAMAFLSNTGREITKGIADVEGDKTKNVGTIAVRHGVKAASILATAFYASAVALSVLPPLMSMVSLWFTPFVTVTDLGLIVSSVMLLKNPSKENAKRVKSLVLVWFMFGLLAFIFGAF